MSISEVIPRFYIQCAFMKFHEYHTEFKTVDTFDILSATVRGMGNPLLAAYSRMFFLKCIGSSGDTNVGNMNISFQRDFNSSSKPIWRQTQDFWEDNFWRLHFIVQAFGCLGGNDVSQISIREENLENH